MDERDKITLAEAARRLELPTRTLERILPPGMVERWKGAWPRVRWSAVREYVEAASKASTASKA